MKLLTQNPCTLQATRAVDNGLNVEREILGGGSGMLPRSRKIAPRSLYPKVPAMRSNSTHLHLAVHEHYCNVIAVGFSQGPVRVTARVPGFTSTVNAGHESWPPINTAGRILSTRTLK